MGSSPLTRGKRRAAFAHTTHPGLIPAHAGKTAGPPPPISTQTAHPRSRGENSASTLSSAKLEGSSPLTRGKPVGSTDEHSDPRLIPAHAGKTRVCPRRRAPAAAHPRSRGENGASSGPACRIQGSSPLTRGKQVLGALPRGQPGLIPAHAGKTGPGPSGPISNKAHPRSRGENITWIAQLITSCGSSPLTRGKPVMQLSSAFSPGLIPAHAGKTWKASQAYSLAWAHPRSRGENHRRSAITRKICGSSPLTRGKPRSGRTQHEKDRLIPAHAGKTLSRRLTRRR